MSDWIQTKASCQTASDCQDCVNCKGSRQNERYPGLYYPYSGDLRWDYDMLGAWFEENKALGKAIYFIFKDLPILFTFGLVPPAITYTWERTEGSIIGVPHKTTREEAEKWIAERKKLCY